MKVVSASQMRRIDEIAAERGLTGEILMDRAGKAVAREALDHFEPDSAIVVTGKGNNAGDGFIVARELHRHGVRTTLCMLEKPEQLHGAALAAYQTLPAELHRLTQPDPAELHEEFIQYDLLVDALFGTGLRGPLDAPWTQVIAAINAAHVNVLAIDIPSGLPGEPGVAVGAHVRATLTVTIGLPKLTMIVDPGVRATGHVVVADIGFPRDLLDAETISTNLMTLDEARALLPPRRPGGHKGTFGRLLVLAGSEGMTGAAVLTARAATRSGVGLVYSGYPRALGAIMESHLIEPVKVPLAGREAWFTAAMAEAALQAAADAQAVAIGPGIERRPTTGVFLHRVVEALTCPLVIDASGLDLLAEKIEQLALRPGPTVLTPHPKEAARLLKCSVEEVEAHRLEAFAALARHYGVVTVLKGAQTIITAPDGQRYINPTGNSGLAKGGSGDVLTGLIGGLLAQGCSAPDAARLGVFLHGMAADLAAEHTSVRAMIPSDIIQTLGEAFLRLEKNRP